MGRLPFPKTRGGRVELLPAPIAADLPRLRAALAERPASLVLVGRRHPRSTNSWTHNVPKLNGGSNRCTVRVHPADAERLGLTDGAPARITTEAGETTIPVEITDTVRTGVVSVPHGWGTAVPAPGWRWPTRGRASMSTSCSTGAGATRCRGRRSSTAFRSS